MRNYTDEILCGCGGSATVIFEGVAYCSRHGLIVVLERLEALGGSDAGAGTAGAEPGGERWLTISVSS